MVTCNRWRLMALLPSFPTVGDDAMRYKKHMMSRISFLSSVRRMTMSSVRSSVLLSSNVMARTKSQHAVRTASSSSPSSLTGDSMTNDKHSLASQRWSQV